MAIVIDKMALLVIVLVAIIFLVWLLLGPGKDYAFGLLEDWGLISAGLEDLEVTNLQDAISCAYYRCVEGCDSSKVTGLEICTEMEEGACVGELKNCKENFCDPFDVNNDRKVCDDESKAGVIEVTFTEEPYSILKPISSPTSSYENPLELIYPNKDNCDPPYWTHIKVQKSLLVNPDKVAGTKGAYEACKKSCKSTSCNWVFGINLGCVQESARECKLKPATVYVWEEEGEEDETPVIVCANPPSG